MAVPLQLLLSAATPAFLGRLFPPTVKMADGRRLTLHGTGPPVLWSGALFGTVPHHVYSDLFARLEKNLTLVVPEGPLPVSAGVVERAADALAVAQVGFFGHSAFDGRVLESRRVHRAVLCDPILLPSLWTPPSPGGACCPTRVMRSELGAGLAPAQLAESTERVHARVGHLDVLDDAWAELGARTVPWVRGVQADTVAFEKWSRDSSRLLSASAVRRSYRDEVAVDAAAFFAAEDSGHPSKK